MGYVKIIMLWGKSESILACGSNSAFICVNLRLQKSFRRHTYILSATTLPKRGPPRLEDLLHFQNHAVDLFVVRGDRIRLVVDEFIGEPQGELFGE